MTSTFPRNFLFGLLAPDERKAATVHFWEHTPPEVRAQMLQALAQRLGFRTDFVKRRPKEWIIAELLRQFESPRMEGQRHHLHRHHLLRSSRQMILDILEAEGTPHDGVEVAKDAPPPSREAFLRGIRRVTGSHPDREVCMFYDACLSCGSHYAALGEVIQCEELKTAFDRLMARHPSTASEVAGGASRLPCTAVPAPGGAAAALAQDRSIEPATIPAGDGFTVLDQLLIRTLVASAASGEHALSHDQAEGLVDEVVSYCPERCRSWFHPGFLEALLGQPLSLEFAGTNPDRRAWKLTGYLLGTTRAQAPDLARILREHPGAWRELLEPTAGDGRLEARRALLVLIPSLIRAALWQPLAQLLAGSPSPTHRVQMEKIYNLTVAAACDLIDNGRHEDAIPCLNGLLRMGSRMPNPEEDWNRIGLDEVARRLGQAHMRAGRFHMAIPILEPLVAGSRQVDRINRMADLWLARAGLRSMSAFLPGENARADQERFAAMDDRPLVEAVQAARDLGVHGAHAHLALGLLRFHQERRTEADQHLSIALGGMMHIEAEYQTAGLVERVRFLLGLVIAELMDPSRLNEALAHLAAASDPGLRHPLRLWEAWTRALALANEPERAAEAAGRVIERDARRGWRLVVDSGLTHPVRSLRRGCREWIRQGHLEPKEAMATTEVLLSHALEEGDFEGGENLLDDLESLARRFTPCAEQFVAILGRRRSGLLAIWDEDSLDLSMAATLETLNRLNEAAEILRRAFFRARQYESPNAAEAFLACLEQLQVLDPQELERLRGMLPGVPREQVPADPGALARPVSVLFVGGNETQARQERDILGRLAASMPGLRVTFRFPGWSANWNVDLEDCRRLLPAHDVVVIHRFVRTQFGRSLRALCGAATPWRACTGTGRQSLVMAIEQAARWASARAAG